MKFKQSWFLADGSELPEDAAVGWVIPLTVLADGVTHSTVLAAKEDTWTFPTSEQASSWLWRRAAIRARASIPKHARHYLTTS